MHKAIGIDLGGTKINGGIIDSNGEVLKRVEMETGKEGPKEVLGKVSHIIDSLLMEDDDILGIGIGSPGFIDNVRGKVLSFGGNISDWQGFDIKGELSKLYLGKRIFVENDANAAAICEGWIGAGKDFSSFIMVTLGTGIGGALYTREHGIWHGHSFQGGELGHVILYPKGHKCKCGQFGCSEQYISGTAIERRYKKLTGVYRSCKHIFCESSGIANKVVDEFVDNLAIFLCTLKNFFDPEAIVIGGGLINSKDCWWEKMINRFHDYVNDSSSISIVPAKYLNNAGMIGAGKMVFDR